MSHELPQFKLGLYVANADLSAKQFYFVKMVNSSGIGKVDLTGTNGESLLGVLQNKPTAGQVAEVMVQGVSKITAGGSITAAGRVMTDNTGKAIAAATTGSHAIGFIVDTVASGDLGSIILPGGIVGVV